MVVACWTSPCSHSRQCGVSQFFFLHPPKSNNLKHTRCEKSPATRAKFIRGVSSLYINNELTKDELPTTTNINSERTEKKRVKNE